MNNTNLMTNKIFNYSNLFTFAHFSSKHEDLERQYTNDYFIEHNHIINRCFKKLERDIGSVFLPPESMMRHGSKFKYCSIVYLQIQFTFTNSAKKEAWLTTTKLFPETAYNVNKESDSVSQQTTYI